MTKLSNIEQENKHQIMIDGGVMANVDHEVFTDKFLEWIESNGWSFRGGIGPYDIVPEEDIKDNSSSKVEQV